MRGVLQRVKSASVVVGKQKISQIGTGILLLLGIADTDTEKDVAYICEKTLNMRIFPDGNGKLNLSLKEAGGSVLLVSQFTLYGDVRKGRRPSFSRAAVLRIPNRCMKRPADILNSMVFCCKRESSVRICR